MFFKKKVNKDDAFLELQSFIYQNGLEKISKDFIEGLNKKYGLNVTEIFSEELFEFYTNYFTKCLSDKLISEEEMKDIEKLKDILMIDNKKASKIEDEIRRYIFLKQVDEVVADGKIDNNERESLDKLANNLNLKGGEGDTLYTSKAKQILEKKLSEIIADNKVSPDEEKELNELAQNLGITLKIEDDLRLQLDKFRLFWNIENGEIPIVDVDINLQSKEKCYFSTQAEWHELRRVTQRVGYSGPTLRIKITKGLYWRAGNLGARTYSDDVLTHIDTGYLYLTNKRIIFKGVRKNTTIQLSKILDFIAYKDGVEIQKDSGKNPFLKFNQNIDVFSAILGRVIKDYGQL